MTDAELFNWANHRQAPPNLGLACGFPVGGAFVCALDLDVDDEALVAEIREALGLTETPMRLGRRGGVIPYLGDAQRGADFRASGAASHLVQKLGRGKQWVCPPSIHPSGVAYRWDREGASLPDVSELPTIADTHLQEVLARFGFTRGKVASDDVRGEIVNTDAANELFLSEVGPLDDDDPQDAEALRRSRALIDKAFSRDERFQDDWQLAPGDASSTALRRIAPTIGAAFRGEFESDEMARRAAASLLTDWLREHARNEQNTSDRFVGKCLTMFDVAYSAPQNDLAFIPTKDDGVTLAEHEAWLANLREARRTKTDGGERRYLDAFEAAGDFNPAIRLRPRQILAPHWFVGMASVLAAPGGTGKSSLALVEALSIHLGQDLLGWGKAPVRRNALIINGEDSSDEISLRLQAVISRYGLDRERVASIKRLSGRMLIPGLPGAHISIMMRGPSGEVVPNWPVLSAMKTYCLRHEVGAILLDPASTLLGCSISDNDAVSQAVRFINATLDEIGAACMIVHHTRKLDVGGQMGIDDIKGASALVDHARSARILKRMSKAEARDSGVPEADARYHVRVDEEGAKVNLTPAMPDTRWLKIVGEKIDFLPDDEFEPTDIQVVVPTSTPVQSRSQATSERLSNMTESEVEAILHKIDEGWNRPNNSTNGRKASDAFFRVLQLDGTNEGDRVAVNKVLRSWLASRRLVKVQEKDANRNRVSVYKRGASGDAFVPAVSDSDFV